MCLYRLTSGFVFMQDSCQYEENINSLCFDSQPKTDTDDVISRSPTVPPSIVEGANQSYSVLENKQVRLNCPVEGYPKPRIRWLFNGEPILPNDLNRFVDEQGYLNIIFATEDDEGTYTCEAENAAGQDTLDIALHVLGEMKKVLSTCQVTCDTKDRIKIWPIEKITFEFIKNLLPK